MAIFKAIVKGDRSSVGHATPNKLEDYLKFETKPDGKKVPKTDAVSAINADAVYFALDCEALGAYHGTCRNYDDLKYKHYIQGFPPEDCGKMTREKCHELGVEAAKTLWGDFPVLVVTHYEQEVEGTGEYHWHNHFLVYNCNIYNGRKINTKGSELWAQKRFIAAQADANGLTRKGLILENGRIRESQLEVKTTLAERKMRQRKQAELNAQGGGIFVTQKAELRLAIISAINSTDSYESFCKYLEQNYNIKTKDSRGSLGFLHPRRQGENRAWVRGKALGENFTKEAIINELNNPHDKRRYKRLDEYADKFEYFKAVIREIYGYSPPDIRAGEAENTRSFLEQAAEERKHGAEHIGADERARGDTFQGSGDSRELEQNERSERSVGKVTGNAQENNSKLGGASTGKLGFKP